jgi:HK97 family phage portal protein
VIEIARAFGVPPHLIGETSASTSWGSGIETLGRGFVTYTLQPHLRRFEQELNRKLFPRTARFFCEFDRSALQAGDSKAQAEVLRLLLGGPGSGPAVITPNQARRSMQMPPVDGGDQLYWPDTSAKAGTTPPTQPTDPTP